MRSLNAALLLLTLAAAARAEECWVSWDCRGISGCVRLYGTNSGRRGPFASCAGWKQMDQVSSCKCGAASGSISSGDAVSAVVDAVMSGNQQAAQMAVGMAGAQMVGQGIGQMLRGDPAAAERAKQADEQRLMKEAAERHERERRFVENKERLLGQMDGARPAGGGLGFKDDEAAPAAPKRGGACQAVVDSCAAKLAEQEKLLGDANIEAKKDVGAAIAKSHLGFKDDDGDEKPAAAPAKIWENEDRAGLPLQLHPGKTTADDLFEHLRRQRIAALNGKYSPKKKNLADALGVDLDPKAAADKAGELKEQAEAFRAYMRNLIACARDQEANFNACVTTANQTYDKAVAELEKAGYDKAALKRVREAREAYTKYVARFADRSSKLWEGASSCLASCR